VFLCRPFGTRLINHSSPGTDVPGYRLLRPCGTASCWRRNPFEPLNRLRKRILLRVDNGPQGLKSVVEGPAVLPRVLTHALSPEIFSSSYGSIKSCPDKKQSFSATCGAQSWAPNTVPKNDDNYRHTTLEGLVYRPVVCSKQLRVERSQHTAEITVVKRYVYRA
jgi:hypothetical protein